VGAEYFQANGHRWKHNATSPADSQEQVHMNKMKIVIIYSKVISLDNNTLFTHLQTLQKTFIDMMVYDN
jgi:ABC-type lipoprotein release transport system permease subunit